MNYAGHARIHLNTERWRVCETWFSPGMAGVDSAGLGEVLQSVLAGFPDSDKGRLVKVGCVSIFLSPIFFTSKIFFRTYLSLAHHATFRGSFRDCKVHSDRFCRQKCHSRSCALLIHRWTRGEAWRISRKRRSSIMSVLPKQSMKSGEVRG